MLNYSLSERGDTPIYRYLYRQIKNDILSGKLTAGEKLPSKRSLAQTLNVGVITVENAYSCLISEGYIDAKEKKGYFVARIERLPTAERPVREFRLPERRTYSVDLRSGAVDTASFPVSIWNRLSREVITERSADFFRPCAPTGAPELRHAIADYLRRVKSIETSPDCIVIAAGTEMLLYSIVRLLGGYNVYAAEEPGYPKIPAVYTAAGARCIALPSDAQGVDTEALRNSPASVLHVSPNHHYPTGRITSLSRRSELLRWAAERAERYIVEDDFDSEFRFDAHPIGRLFSIDFAEKVISMNTFSKTISPSLRIGYLVLPPHLTERYLERSEHFSCTVSAAEQLTLARFIADGYYEGHIARMRRLYGVRRKKFLEMIRRSPLNGRIRITEQGAGLHFLLKLPDTVSEEAISALARKNGVGLSFLSQCSRYSSAMEKGYLIVNYGGIDEDGFDAALRFLEKAICAESP